MPAILNMALRVLNLPLGLSLSKPIHPIPCGKAKPTTSSGRTGILQNENCCLNAEGYPAVHGGDILGVHPIASLAALHKL
jgi:hypothetical protein